MYYTPYTPGPGDVPGAFDCNTEALLRVAKRCEEQGRSNEAEQWRECARLYASGECMENANVVDTVDVISEILVVLAIATILLALFL